MKTTVTIAVEDLVDLFERVKELEERVERHEKRIAILEFRATRRGQ